MAVVRITRGRTAETGTRVLVPGGRQPTVKLKTEDEVLELPFGPRGAQLGGWADEWETIARPGRQPLTVRTGDGLPTLGLTVLLGHASDHQRSIEPLLAKLRSIAESGDRVTLVNLSVAERGPWCLEDVTVNVALRQAGTNHATRAEVGLSFIAANNATVKLGPVKGGKTKGGKGGKSGKGKTSRYTVRAGDTLAKIADKKWGEPGKWRAIARRNKIKRPASIKPGDVLVIPPEPDGKR